MNDIKMRKSRGVKTEPPIKLWDRCTAILMSVVVNLKRWDVIHSVYTKGVVKVNTVINVDGVYMRCLKVYKALNFLLNINYET